MSRESAFITRLARFAVNPAARGLNDDVAVLAMGERDLVLTHDLLAEGVHYLSGDPPADVAWKLLAVNLSDLAAKGARPIGVLLGYTLGPDEDWDIAFADAIGATAASFDVPLLGGDTIEATGPRTLGLTAIGEVAPGSTPARSGAKAGDGLWVTGVIGAAGLGLAVAQGRRAPDDRLLAAYRRPTPRLAAGAALARHVHAMADVSDGLLIDAARIAAASKLGVAIDLAAVPCDPAVAATRDARLAAARAGDDYELLFAAAADFVVPAGLDVTVTRIGGFVAGSGLTLSDGTVALPTPTRLGYEHG